MQTTLVTAEWLKVQSAGEVMIFDATYFLPTMGRDGRSEYNKAHIPGAVFFDIDGIKDEASDLPHMIPSAENFQTEFERVNYNTGDVSTSTTCFRRRKCNFKQFLEIRKITKVMYNPQSVSRNSPNIVT